MLFKNSFFLLFLLFFSKPFAQETGRDSLSISQIQKELEAVKALRVKDSVIIASLLTEIQNFTQNRILREEKSDIDSVFLRKREDIERLRKSIQGIPVVFRKDTVYFVYDAHALYSAETRVKHTEEKMELLYENPFFNPDSLTIRKTDDFISVVYKNEIIAGVTQVDALWANIPIEKLAQKQADSIKKTITKHKELNSWKNIFLRIGEFVLVISFTFLVIWTVNRFFRFLKSLCVNTQHRFLNGLKIRNYQLVDKEHISNILLKTLSFVKIAVLVFFFATIIPFSFRIFPSTHHLSESLFHWIFDPLRSVWETFVSYLPKFFNILVILFVARYILRLLRFFATEIERGRLSLKGFHPEWAKTTYNIIRFMLLLLTLVVIFPYLPGSDSDAFKGISVFLGVLISFGSSSAVSNAIAGLVITYMRPFRVGDWIKTGEIIGMVIERDALVTRIKTINNEDVTVPNSAILSGATINYTSIGKESGLALNVQVKVRYEYSHNLVEELLIESALVTQDIAKMPYPYVFQLSLNELNAVYELNAYTFNPNNMYFIKSDLIKNIQNTFKQAKVDIYSTQYVEITHVKEKKGNP